MKAKKVLLAASLIAAAGIAVTATLMIMRNGGFGEPATQGEPTTMRLITAEQYANTLQHLFGEDIDLSSAHFPLLPRIDGLVSLGTAKAEMTPSALEAFNRSARSVAAQVVDASHRGLLMPCAPRIIDQPDPACAGEFLSRVGRFLFRRPLTAEELETYVAIAKDAAVSRGDFYEGIAYSLAGMMTSPRFLYIADVSEPDPERPGGARLDAYSKASRLSLFLWDALPDDELIAAAESGALHDDEELRQQIDRMLQSPRSELGVRAFFGDLLQFQDFETVTKDAIIYPAFTFQASQVVHEQALRMITDHLLVRREDYRDLFTTDQTFVNRALGAVYHTPVPIKAASSEWVPYRVDSDKSAGLLTSLSFMTSHSHPGRSSPTLRGKALREIFLCQKVPAPPPTVDFTLFEDLSGKQTARERLKAHAVTPACSGCHRLTDPIGLAFENYDGAGQFRSEENGAAIDTTGVFDGQPIGGIADVGRALRNHPSLTSCLARRLFAYGVGHDPGADDREWLAWVVKRFAAHEYRFPDLLREMAQSRAFYAVAAPGPARLSMNTGAEGDR